MNTFTKIGVFFLLVGSCLAGHANKRLTITDVPKNGYTPAIISAWHTDKVEPTIAAVYNSWPSFSFANFSSDLLKPFASKKFVHYTATTGNSHMLGVGPVQNGIGTDGGKTRLLPTLSAYPNPSKGRVTISLTQTSGDIYKIKISNTIGKVIQTITLGENANAADISIDLSDRPAGIYFYSLLVNDKMVETKRLILQQ
ncbi:T9SS type A sorting domain-containing protein [Adhaeribacter radiodurans]|uniref:T9SS type A sorting domain-containing protein n=1 Tax=Adhaeribacter radiodurans TaxID=2745197 RepID=A0A7L7L4J7_9BACT|nr:T9SS type A sorting domain-containing protein [Adhaeribacter radiodurans]QMU27741.1 T9SS type A sorting domain-containing protein [Adhaeribacter radiodurans]